MEGPALLVDLLLWKVPAARLNPFETRVDNTHPLNPVAALARARLWTLDSGLWTLDSGLWTLDSGRGGPSG